MRKHPAIKVGVLFFILSLFLAFFLETETMARVGGGRSSGSRGSRSYSVPRTSPSSPLSQPSQGPQRVQPSQPAQPAPQGAVRPPQAPPAQQPQGGLWRGIAGGILGGLIGGMLFRSLGFAGGHSGFGGGIGLIEILLLAAILFGVFWFFKKRRLEAASQSSYQASTEPVETYSSSGSSYGQPPLGDQDLERGIGHIQQMDSSFSEKAFRDQCMDLFFKIQGAWANRDMSGVKSLLTEEMFGILQRDAERLRTDKRINRLENIAVRSVDLVEAWQESGQDFTSVRFYANLLDYTEDETTGKIVSGSKTDPVKFEEFWTFTRPVGKNGWRLSAIQQVE